jgi:hypothetical protein
VLSLLRSSMTPAHRFARVLVLPQYLCGLATHLAARRSTAPRCSSCLEMSACPPCQRMSSVRRADPPSCGLPCDSTRSTSPMRSTDFCFPHCFRLRALAPRSFPASLRGLRLAPSPWACTPDEGDWGTWRFKTPDPLQRAAPGFSRGVSSSARSRCHRASDIPVASPWPSPRLFAKRDSAGSAETVPACVP